MILDISRRWLGISLFLTLGGRAVSISVNLSEGIHMTFRYLRKPAAVIIGLGLLVVPALAYASSTPTLSQTVNAGTLTTGIYQSDDATPVASPSVAFPALNRSFSCQTSTAMLGDANDKLNVTNFGSNNGWTLTMAATGGSASTWSDGTHSYKFNDATGSGCTNGQLTVDPSASALTLDCNSACTSTGVTKGSSTSYVSGTTDSVTLASLTSGSAWEGYFTGIALSQKVPASQAAGSYSLGMTITVTAQ